MDEPSVPPHVEQSVAAIVELHRSHFRRAGRAQRVISTTTAAVARPATLAVIAVAVTVWVALNTWLTATGRVAPDPYPYAFLSLTVSAGGFLLAAMILIAQRHDDELSTLRDQLTLELAILSEQKTAKLIALLEELRRSVPDLENRRDEIAEALAEPADPSLVLGAIEAAHREPGA
ncbi:putative membrane protein [Roseiarcus fermentans]|uniref:Putative membrane protein n=1 Tax=Roseiarcus fermentans TaxID=1473586 RepID=A0A366FJ52_9HYPH|nr:DUF1003 domain-containing protein [Roseiarcus fermentans]RBP13755.1 putative membrane protein [Roseiarcus fermentans]